MNGVLNETETGSWSVREPRSWSAADVNGTLNDNNPNITIWDSGHPEMNANMFYRTDLQVVIPDSVSLVEPAGVDSRTAVPRAFNITQTTVVSLQTIMGNLFLPKPGSILKAEYVVVYPMSDPATSSNIADIFWNATTNGSSLSTTFEDLAHRLTIQLRETSTGNIKIQGQVQSYVLHIRVDWGFFVLLVITFFFGAVYFAGVLVQTHRLGLPVWKESAYPALAYGLDEETQTVLRSTHKDKEAVNLIRREMVISLHDTNMESSLGGVGAWDHGYRLKAGSG